MKEDIYRSQFRLPYELYEKLKLSADLNRRSVNAELVALLEEALDRSEPRNKPEDEMYTAEEMQAFIEKLDRDISAMKASHKPKN